MSEAVSAGWRRVIRARLDEISREADVTILLAIESGSRAWGFHSEDSDYDVRFIYCRRVDWHLTVEPGRDVIERPISGELDLSGWDLRKTLGLILGSNAVALEWLQSPITYAEAPGFREELAAFARGTLRRRPVQWHYRRLAERQMDGLRNPDGSLRLKRYFYTIRPVLALRWLRLHPDLATPPMDMTRLMRDCALPDDVHGAILDLIARKKRLAERDDIGEPPEVTEAMIAMELAMVAAEPESDREETPKSWTQQADAILSRWTRRCDPSVGGHAP